MNALVKYGLLILTFSCISLYALPKNSSKRVKHIAYYANGTVKEKGFYKNEQKQGIWWTFYETGIRKSKAKHKKGNRIYLFEYNEKGNLFQITNKNGEVTEVEDCGC